MVVKAASEQPTRTLKSSSSPAVSTQPLTSLQKRSVLFKETLLLENKAKAERRGKMSERKGGKSDSHLPCLPSQRDCLAQLESLARSNLAHLCACAELDSGLSYWLAWAAQVDAPDSLNYSNLSLSTDVSPNLFSLSLSVFLSVRFPLFWNYPSFSFTHMFFFLSVLCE